METTLSTDETGLEHEQIVLEFAEFAERACLERGYSGYNAVCFLRELKSDLQAFERAAHSFHSFLDLTVDLNVSDGLAEDEVRQTLDAMVHDKPLTILHHFRTWREGQS